MLKILQGRIRIPDVSFIRWDRLPEGRVPVPAVSPDLAVEVLSKSNTEREMQDKLDEYFAGGTRLAWIIDPQARRGRSTTRRTNALLSTRPDRSPAAKSFPARAGAPGPVRGVGSAEELNQLRRT